MRNRKYQKLTIGGVDYSQYFHFPFMVQKALDESLDFAVIELSNTRIKDPFKPFQTVVIGSGDTALTFITAQDEVEEKFGLGLYKHTITVIEKTKETERIICGAKAFTNPLVRDYTDGQTLVKAVRCTPKTEGGTEYQVSEVDRKNPIIGTSTKSPVTIGTLPIYTDFGFAERAELADRHSYSVIIYYSKSKAIERVENSNTNFKIIGEQIAKIDNIPTTWDGWIGDINTKEYGAGTYVLLYIVDIIAYFTEVNVTNVPAQKDPYTVEDVTLQLLDTCETLRVGLDKPRYELRYQDVQQMAKFRQPAPEFRFSNGRSLFENLREIGRYVHAMPRIEHDTATGYDYLFFDELGGTEYADMSKGGRRFGGTASFSIGDYTGGLESMVSNLVNLDDEAEGSITEPFEGGYVSMRTETETARIGEETGFIKTTYPIEKIISVQVGDFVWGGTQFNGVDVTPFIFEKAEYDILSSFSGAYPTSKTYALYYTQGSPNIQGLWYKAQDGGSDIFNAFESFSIVNIISSASGFPSDFAGTIDSYTDLIFRITYIPSVTARVRQYKPTYDGAFPSVMVHNQSANKLAAKAFGENLRGQLAMMGTTSETVMYIFQRLEDVPKPGTLYDDNNYISTVSVRVWHDYVIAQIGLSTGYNELGAYVEINNAIRQFEIPDSEDRYTVLEEFCVVGTQSGNDENLAITKNFRDEVVKAFSSGSQTGMDVSLAITKSYDEDGNEIQGVPTIALPAISLAIGDSLYFGFRFEDNFGAGSQSEPGDKDFRSQKYVPYADQFYSHAHSVGFTLKSRASVSTSLTGKIETAHALPEAVGITGGTDMVSTGDHPILWHKDSADAGCFTYQLHFMTNDNLIIGDGLAHHCAAVRTVPSTSGARIYFYKDRINQLTGTTDTVNQLYDYLVWTDTYNGRIYYIGAASGFKSWAIIKDGRFMLGKNDTVMPGDIYFNFKRRIPE